MPAYDETRFNPPAPTCEAVLRDNQTGNTIAGVVLLLDSGADITLLPETAAKSIGVVFENGKQYEIMNFDGQRRSLPSVVVDLIWLGKTFRGRFLLVEKEHGIIGRDILNHVTLLLDGPKSLWDEWKHP
ncbi:MAG: retropepsin-like domain-containing protein [Gemmataceae bacterium]|nr:retropepsin-like domain-containing protein [Gemmataceae bacterium]MCI0742894.1 retropepsin-like domain-containing protein [Gemmataceae bacterium]